MFLFTVLWERTAFPSPLFFFLSSKECENGELSICIRSFQIGLLAWYAVLISPFLWPLQRALKADKGRVFTSTRPNTLWKLQKGRVSRKSTLSFWWGGKKCHGRDRRLAPQRGQNSTGCYALSHEIWAETLTFVLQSTGVWKGDRRCKNCNFSSSPPEL